MALWRCRHRRSSPLIGTDFSDLASWPSYALAAALEQGAPFPAELVSVELLQRQVSCPVCRAQNRRNSQHWSALALAIVLALLVACAAATSSCSATPSCCTRCR